MNQIILWDFPGGSDGKVSAYNEGDPDSIRVGKISWRRKWQPIPVFLSGEIHHRNAELSWLQCHPEPCS